MPLRRKYYSKCSVFDFGFEIRIKTILPLINRLINEVLLVDDRFSTRCCFRSWTSLAGFSDKHVPACWFQLVGVSKSWCTGVVFMQPGVKVNGAHYYDVLLLKQLLLSSCWRLLCRRNSVLLRMRVALENQDSELYTKRGLSTDHTSVL